MTWDDETRSTRTSRVIRARPDDVYRAFTDTGILLAWLPPGEMTGELHEFDPRVGGGYRMSLYYPPGEQRFQGKTASNEDMVVVRFIEMTPPRRIVEGVTFVTSDPALKGEMVQTITLEPIPEGTNVTLVFEKLPAGLRPADNDEGARMSLAQLARRFE
jgi:uncharacterized protein YndB with AHSA1/START domain